MSLYIVQCGARTIFGVFLVLLCCNDCGYTKSTDVSWTPAFTSAPCGPGMFRCPEGKCISKDLLCNDQKDCDKAEDEYQNCPPPECDPGMLSCRQYHWNKTYCYPPHYKCDKSVDCVDGSDEDNCVYRTCQSTDFHCEKGVNPICIPKEKQCNGYYDCRNKRDEENCTSSNVSNPCSLDQFRCANGQKCIDPKLKCDHNNDCGDQSDELDCNFVACHVGQFRCANSRCIPKNYHCDGYADCNDGSDEANCTTLACPGKFLCPHGGPNGKPKCIAKSQLCDQKKDCEDNADEESACSTISCPALNCEYKCQASPTGGACICQDGFKIANDSKKCVDRDECSEWGFCDQQCRNTEGSYVCSCFQGFDLVDNNRTCLASRSYAPSLVIFAHDKSILRMDSRGQNQKVIGNGSSVSSLDFHFTKNFLFWIDVKTKKVHCQDLIETTPGSSLAKREFTLPGSSSPIALATDWVGNKLYVVDSLGQKIDVFEFDGRYHAIVMGSNLTNPTDIALDPFYGLMFVADSNQILRAHMDGTNVKAIMTEAVYKASGIAVDTYGKRVFWCDSLLDYIETVDYMGNNRFLILRGPAVPAPTRLAVFENQVYWSDSTKQGIMSVNKYGGPSSIQTVFKNRDVKDPKAVKIVHSLLQKPGFNPCEKHNGYCQHLCIVTKVAESENLGFRCACNIGFSLQADLKTCNPVSEFLLYSQQRFIKGRVLNPYTDGFSDAILPVVSRRARFVGLDFDYENNHIYYSDVLQDVIYRVYKNGTGREIVLASQNEGVEGLAVDWVAKNLYYIDSRKGTLNVLSTRNITNRRVLLKNLKRPRAIVVHPNRGVGSTS